MKKLLIIIILIVFLPGFVEAKGKDSVELSKSCYYTAKEELQNMLDGKDELSYEHAIYIIENAYWDNKIDVGKFQAAIEYNTGIIRQIIAANHSKRVENKSDNFYEELRAYRNEDKGYHEKALANWGIYTFMTDTAFSICENRVYYVIDRVPFHYSTNDPFGTNDWTNTEVINLLANGQGNCFALASLFKIFSERLNTDANICTAPGHVYICHKDDKGTQYNIELSGHSFPGTGTIETLTYTTDDAVKNDISLRELNLKQSVALCLVYLAKGYEYKFKERGDDFALQCAESALKYDSLNLNAMLLKAEVLETNLINRNKSVVQLQTDHTFREYQSLVSRLYQLGYREMPLDMKNQLIKGWTRDSEVAIITEDHTSKTFNHLGVQYNRYASLSWGLYDEDIIDKSLEKYSRTVFDTKKNKIAGFVKQDVLYNDYNFDPVVFAMNVDPMAHKLPGWSPYAFCKDNPIMNFDPDGAFPYTFHVRAFAPPDVFKPTDFHDDGRGYSARTDVTSRIQQSFTIDPTARSYSGGHPTSDPTIWHGMSKTAHDDGGISTPEFGTNSVGSATASTTADFSGSNPFFYGAAPNIKVSSAISVTENLKKNQLMISMDVSSKEFPASEAFVQDVTGKAVFLGGAAANGSPLDLATRGQKGVINVNLTIGINDKGEFQNVTVGDKTYSIDEYNKMGTSQPAVQKDSK